MNFSTNQNRQLYVGTYKSSGEPTNIGDITMLESTEDANFMAFQYKTANGDLLCSDKIDTRKVVDVRKSAPTGAAVDVVEITFTTANIEALCATGCKLLLNITFRDAYTTDVYNNYSKSACVACTSTDTNLTFAKKVADEFQKTLNADVEPFATVEVTGGKVTITGLTSWVLGTRPEEPCQFDVTASLVGPALDPTTKAMLNQDDIDMVYGDDMTPFVTIDKQTMHTPNGRVLADLEYFCAGERGDQLRGAAYPNNFKFKGLVDPDAESDYDVVDLIYYKNGANEDVQKSQSVITFITEAGDGAALEKAIKDKIAGISRT